MRLMKQMIAPAEVSRSWMSVADDSVVYQSGAKFPLLTVVYTSSLRRISRSVGSRGDFVRPLPFVIL